MDRMSFGVLVRTIVLASLPYDVKLLLGFSAFEPVHPLIIRFCSFGGHGFVDESLSCGVVGHYCCFRMGVAHLC